MEQRNKEIWFGFFKEDGIDEFEKFIYYDCNLNKREVIEHIKECNLWLNGNETPLYDIFTDEYICLKNVYEDGKFMISEEFIYYFDKYDIGIPPEYEEYLIKECGLKPIFKR